MSITYGGERSDTIPGVKVRLLAWPSLGGLEIEATEKSGEGGRVFGEASQTHTSFRFEVTIWGDTPDNPHRDAFIGLVDPSGGPRDLILETDRDWKFPSVIASQGVEWDPVYWDPVKGFVWRGLFVMETVGVPYAVPQVPAVETFTSSLSFTLNQGNTRCHPTIEFPSGAETTVKVGDFTVVVGATAAGGTVVLDYEKFQFYLENSSGVRTASVVNLMSHYLRASVLPGQTVVVSATGAPAGTRRFNPNPRRK